MNTRALIVMAGGMAWWLGCGEVKQPAVDAGLTFDAPDGIDGSAGIDAMPDGAVPDTTPPDTTILTGPDDPSNSATATFTFTSEGAGNPSPTSDTFQCRLDTGAFAVCSSPHTLTGVSEGVHTFEVFATDADANSDPSPASRSWTVDLTAPTTTITSAPSNPTDQTSATFAFNADEAATFECQLDGGAFATCVSGVSYTGLSENATHTFAVRATDTAGNVGPSATRSWSIDTSFPSVTILTGPANPTNTAAANFTFSADAGVTLVCRLDGSNGACTSSTTMSYANVGAGSHTFEVDATNALNKTSTATYTWTVDLTAPVVTIVSGPANPTNQTSATFVFSANEVVTFQCTLDGNTGACNTTSMTSYSGLAPGFHTFVVSATDTAGNTGAAMATWEIDVTPVLAVTPLTRDFGNQLVGSSSGTQVFTFTNSGVGNATGCAAPALGGSNPGDFTIQADTCGTANLAAGGGSCTVTVFGTPSTTGARTTTLSRTCAVGGTVSTSINGIRVTGTAPSLSLSPLTHDFGNQLINTSTATRTFTFSNTGTASATGCASPVLGGSNPGDFSIQSNTCGTNNLAAGSSCTVTVRGTPSVLGLRRTTLSRTCSLGGTVSTTANGIQVTGIGSPILAVAPLAFGFGPVAVGANSAATTFTFSNSGNGAATGCSAPTRGGANPNDYTILVDNCGTSNLAAGSSCTVQVRVTPAAAGIRTMTLSRNCSVGGTVSTTANAIEVNKPMYIFISSVSYDGNLGGLNGADAKCQALGSAGTRTGPLNKTWRALISKTTGGVVNARDRFTWTGPMFDMNVPNRAVTMNPSVWPWVNAGANSSIGVNESGGPPDDSYVWTGSTINGVARSNQDCNNWSSSTNAFNGWSGETDSFSSTSWFDSYSDGCSYQFFGLYCVSQ